MDNNNHNTQLLINDNAVPLLSRKQNDDEQQEQDIPPHVQALMIRFEQSLWYLVVLGLMTYFIGLGYIIIEFQLYSNNFHRLDDPPAWQSPAATTAATTAAGLWQSSLVFCLVVAVIATVQGVRLYRLYQPWKDLVRRCSSSCIFIITTTTTCSMQKNWWVDEYVRALLEQATALCQVSDDEENDNNHDNDEDENVEE